MKMTLFVPVMDFSQIPTQTAELTSGARVTRYYGLMLLNTTWILNFKIAQTWRFNCSTALKFDARQKFCKDEGDVNDNCNAFFTIYTEDEVFDLRANDY